MIEIEIHKVQGAQGTMLCRFSFMVMGHLGGSYHSPMFMIQGPLLEQGKCMVVHGSTPGVGK